MSTVLDADPEFDDSDPEESGIHMEEQQIEKADPKLRQRGGGTIKKTEFEEDEFDVK